MNPTQQIFIGNAPQQKIEKSVRGGYVQLLGEQFYKIENVDALAPFFMSIVSSYDHWLYISSSGGLSAGRVSAEQALFPYYTEDRLSENSDNTGSKTILLVTRAGRTSLWEPFSERQQGCYALTRNLYKNIPGTALVFEETNLDLGLTFCYAWRTGDRFGFIRTGWLANTGDSACMVELIDGLQNLLPANVSSQVQNTFSCLLDAYKRSELLPDTGLGIFALNSTLTDLPEPSESLLATTVFQVGLDADGYLISSVQLDSFRSGNGIAPETDIRGRRGAYFAHASLEMAAGGETAWHIIADVNQDNAAIVRLNNLLKTGKDSFSREIEQDITANTVRLCQIVGSADGLQVSADALCTSHHFANVMFNVMRGGIFADQYKIERADLLDFVTTHDHTVINTNAAFFEALPATIHVSDLLARADASGSADLVRLCYTYLPLTFSRRHGDPSRPWNRFAINIKKADGSQRLDYEGNWRDIFQNWEALAYSYPVYIEGMIFTFLGATTADGYNPYRVTRAGLDWETPEPGNPWANIGYWSDHQIIYLQKLMEFSAKVHPGKLSDNLERRVLSYANVPYHIKPYRELHKDPYNTIRFDRALETEIEARVKTRGTDGRLVLDADGQVLHRSLAEKLLTLLLAKLVNFVPEGGIWMNTQRPEWNDANNALVGKGLSVVTLGYLRRYIAFCRDLFSRETPASLEVSAEVASLFAQIAATMQKFQPGLSGAFNDEQRRAMMDSLGAAGSEYREKLYAQGLSGNFTPIPGGDILSFLDLALRFIEHSLRANKRADNLYHAYNILHFSENRASIGYLYEMLEGQVSILSSGMLSGEESLALLDSLRHSPLYRADQHTYILYPDKVLPGFLEKNSLSPDQVRGLRLVTALTEAEDKTLFARDENGNFHFGGNIRNLKDVNRALDALEKQDAYAGLVAAERQGIAALFETIFHHNEFTGRSGTFFAYEGLGSIYWHMVSKLLLAVQETAIRCQHEPVAPELVECYRDIRAGLGFHKTPEVYGAFPTDPYSHTPKGQGARQPGMTGMVKEEILTRQAEVGIAIEDGCVVFNPFLLDKNELLAEPASFSYQDVAGQQQELDLPARSLVATICQVPVVLHVNGKDEISVQYVDGTIQKISGNKLDTADSLHIYKRDNIVKYVAVQVKEK